MPLRLNELPTDALEKLFEHVRPKFPLKLACRATRDAHPHETETPHSFVMQTLAHFEWARGCGYECDKQAVLRAAEFGRDDILHWLVKILKVEWDPQMVFAHACSAGSIPVLEYLEDEARTDYAVRHAIAPADDEASWACSNAAANGHLHVLRWLEERGHQIGYATALSAARGGRLAVLIELSVQINMDHQEFLEQAAEFGHTDCVTWLANMGCPFTSIASHNAAKNGHLETLKFLCRLVQPHHNTVLAATRNDRLDCVKFCVENSDTFPNVFPDQIMEKACFSGAPKVARWLLEDKLVAEVKTEWIMMAIARNRVNVLEPLFELGHIPKHDTELCEHAVREGTLTMLKLLRERGCAWRAVGDCPAIAVVAIVGFRNHILKWILKSGGFPPNQKLMNMAMLYGNLGALSWLMRQAPFDWEEIRQYGADHAKLRITSFIARGDHHVYDGWPAPWEEGNDYKDGIMPGSPDSS